MNPKVQSRDFSGLVLIVEKTAMDKRAFPPLIALAPLAMKLLMGAGTALGAYGAVNEGRKGNWMGAAGNALMALPGIGWMGRGMKGLQLAGQGIKGTALAGKLAPAAAPGKPWLPGLSKFWGGLKPVQSYRAGRDIVTGHEMGLYGRLGSNAGVQSLTGSKAYGAVTNAANTVGNLTGGFVPQVAGMGLLMGGGIAPQPEFRRMPVQMAAAQYPNRFAGLQSMVGPLFQPQPFPQMRNAV